jgi:GT2 family glycosyltransferase
MAPPTVDLIVPTMDNPEIFGRFINSFCKNTMEPWRLIIVNNGRNHIRFRGEDPRIIVLSTPHNLGWMGGVNGGLEWVMANNPAKYIGWINDDVQIMEHDCGWLTKMVLAFEKEGVGAVGPVSNQIMGQQIFTQSGLPPYVEATRLSGMCFITKKEVIDKVGFLDEKLPGGDDLDYSIRVRRAGYKLAICRRTFLFHNYASTGRRVHGAYWDSREHTDAINCALIAKHGFYDWFLTVSDALPEAEPKHNYIATEENFARSELAEELNGGLVLDLGCGGQKIHPKAVGVDIRPKGKMGVGYNSTYASSADIEADVCDLKELKDSSVDGILAKHLLEHIIRPIPALKEWGRVLKDGGRLVIIVPDWRFCEAIACDPSHTAAYTPESLRDLIEASGLFKISRVSEFSPGYVFGISMTKVPSRVAVAA